MNRTIVLRLLLSLAPVLCYSTGAHSLSVTAVTPAKQIIDAPVQADIVVDFSEAIAPASVDSNTFQVFGHWSGVAQGVVQLENLDTRLRFTPDRPLNAGEFVTVSLSRGITNPAGDSLSQAYAWNFWTKTSERPLRLDFVDTISIRQPGEGLVQSYGSYAGDFNGDGWTDLAVPNEVAVDVRLFLNDGAGNYSGFTIRTLPGGSYPSPNEGCDLNNDGKLDFVVGNAANNILSVMLGDGTGSLSVPASYAAGSGVRGVGIIDLNGDGAEDIVTANRNASTVSIFYNDGSGGFLTPNTFESGMDRETAIAVADFNNDGLQDVAIGAMQSQELALWVGDGNGIILSDQVGIGGNVWMIAAGDVNGDGNCDVVSANSSSNGFSVIRGDGAGNFQPAQVYSVPGTFYLAIDLGDLDGDGDLDLVLSDYDDGVWRVYANDGAGNFSLVQTLPASQAGSCATLHDRDNDGDLDFTGIDEIDDLLFIFTNGCDDNPNPIDSDGDLVFDPCDNCVATANLDQADLDGDGSGDACDPDIDGDGVANESDNCPQFANPGQGDSDSDSIGDECDNCPLVANVEQYDEDADGVGDACDGKLHIQSYEIPDGYVGVGYSYQFTAVGGTQPYQWSMPGGDIPFGTGFFGDTVGVISGVPTTAATYFFTVIASDASEPALADTLDVSIEIVESGLLCGDADGGGSISIGDAVYIINYIFGGGPAPDPLVQGDADCNGVVSIGDAVYIINYIFGGGPAPCASCS